MSEVKHIEFPKIGRLSKATCYVSEKIDGTNSAIRIEGNEIVAIQSRNCLIDSNREGMKDNYGFAAWVRANEKTLIEDLGDGLHFGEWWGPGINRGYGLREKMFSLFDTRHSGRTWLTSNLSVVPLLATTQFNNVSFNQILNDLRANGSYASPGFMCPEGIIVFVYDVQKYFKILLENDSLHKGQLK